MFFFLIVLSEGSEGATLIILLQYEIMTNILKCKKILYIKNVKSKNYETMQFEYMAKSSNTRKLWLMLKKSITSF